jgi:hypothetical protein
MVRRVACVVEGHGDVEALPVLVRRVASAIHRPVHVLPPIRVKRQRVVKENELERAVDLASRKCGPGGRVLIVLDADEDCPATLAPSLLKRARSARSDREVRVVLARREFEAWFVAAAESLAGARGLRATLEPPLHPEEIRSPKAWLSEAMISERSYREVLDQPALAGVMDLQQARRAPSFDKFWRDVESLLEID